MDRYQEKKWFVYLDDHHEGPFSLENIQEKMSGGTVQKTTYVWSEGMADWVPMTDVSEFGSILTNSTQSAQVEALDEAPELKSHTPTASPHQSSTTGSPFDTGELREEGLALETNSFLFASKKEEKPKQAAKVELAFGANKILDPRLGPRRTADVVGVSQHRLSRMLKKLVIYGVLGFGGYFAYHEGFVKKVMDSPEFQMGARTLGDVFQSYLLKAAEKFPILERWVSPVPLLMDISLEDLKDLRKAAGTRIGKDGPQIAVGLSTADLNSPSFYVSTNLMDGAWLELFLEGVPDTMLNQLNFTVKAQIQINRSMGKSAPIRFTDGKQIPRGQYIVYITESALEPPPVKTLLANTRPFNRMALGAQLHGRLLSIIPKDARLLTAKTYFLGGAQDNVYVTRLKEFHDRLQAKAKIELTEIRQFSGTVDARLGSTTSKFKSLKRPKVTAQVKNTWNGFHSQWKKMSAQLNASFSKWTPEALQNDYFYGNLYALIQQAADSVEKVHEMQDRYFSGISDKKAHEIQLGEVTSFASSVISKLKAKIEEYEKLPPTPNGMPRREGL